MGIRKDTTNVNAYGILSDFLVPEVTDDPFTLCLWMKSPGGNRICQCGGDSISNGYGITTTWRISPVFRQGVIYDTGGIVIKNSLTGSVPSATWFCVVIRCQTPPGSLELFLDAVALPTTTGDPSYTDIAANLQAFGLWGNNRDGGPLNRDVDFSVAELACWNSALTNQQITDLLTLRPSQIGTTPDGYFPMEDTSDLSDQQGKFADITLFTPGDFSNDDHPYAPLPPSGAVRTMFGQRDLLGLTGTLHT